MGCSTRSLSRGIALIVIGGAAYTLGSGTVATAPAGPPAAILETATLTLPPQDTYLNLDDTNYSGATQVTAYTWPDYQVANTILMKFDLSALPAGAIIQKAELNLALVQSDTTADSTFTMTAHKLLGRNPNVATTTGYTADGVTNWTASACCSAGIPMAQADLSPAYASQAIGRAPGFNTWDVTPMVQEWMAAPATNFGLALNPDVSKPRDRYRTFASQEHATASLRPYLRLTYAALDVSPPSVAIIAPDSGTSLTGTAAIEAGAGDNVAVAAVQFQIDGTPVGPALTAAPYRLDWDTTTVSDGTYAITAVAQDASGNSAVSAGVSVTTRNGILILAPEDTYLNLDAVNYSTGTFLSTYTWPNNKAANAILMKFDFARLPANSGVQEATLHLNLVASDASADRTYAVAVHKIVGNNPLIAGATGFTANGAANWTPNACCYLGVPLAQADISAAYDTQVIDANAGLTTWTITGLVQEWLLQPALNFGLLLNADASKPADRYRVFGSVEHPDPVRRPYLRISYSPEPPADGTPPSVAMAAPAAGASVSGAVTVSGTASDNTGVTGVQFKLDGANLGSEDTTSPYSVSWNTTTAANGSHTLTAVARDAAGNTSTSAAVVVTAANDTTAPTVSISAPADGANVSNTITVSASASDNIRVVGVQFRLDGAVLGAEDTTSPYSRSWNTKTAASGSHTLTAVARDAAGNTRTSMAVVVTVANDTTAPAVSISAPAGGTTVSGTRTVSATASDNIGVAGVQFKLDGVNLGTQDTASPYSVSWNTATATNASHTLTAVARDAAGNTKTSTAVIVTVLNDTTAPAVSISAPAGGATVSGTIAVSSAATDNIGVSGVQFKLDGVNLGTEDTTSPFSVSWNTTTTTNAGHSLTAVARDAAGNTRTSTAVAVTVSNVAPPSGGIATLYPGDVGIEGHPDVVLAERFDDASLSSVLGRWTDVLNGPAMTLATDVPAGSPGGKSLNIPWAGGGVNNGGHLYKQLTGIDDTLYVRYYIKHPTSGAYDHTGIWMGGSNPASAWPNPQAGVKPAGNDRFIAGAEQNTQLGRFDHYDYWMNMRLSGDGNYWGNLLLNNPGVQAPPGQWLCVEHMVKLNDPASSNGEHAIWLDGVKVSHLGPGFPNGTWSGGIFTQSPAGSPFEGFRWRSDSALKLNWIWLQVYAPDDPAGFNASIKFDHVVAAKKYIGCLSASGDVTAPTAALTAPANGATVSATAAVSANATDNVGVVGVQFKVDGANLGAEDTTSPYSVSWNTTTATNASHTLTASARDAAGNTKTSTAVVVTVANDTTAPAVSISAPTGGATVSGTITVSSTASDNIGVAGVQFKLDGANLGTEDMTSPYSASWNTTTATNATHTLTAVARDAAGNTKASTAVTVTVANVAIDTTAPTASISAPAAGATVSGTTTVSATATDNIGVAGVQFKLDGANLGAEDAAAPYSISWDTTPAANGSHTLTVVARDAAGNTVTSAGRTVTVSNASSGSVIFDSTWDTGIGTAASTVTDGARWPNYWEFNGGSSVQLLSVVSGGPNGHNALRVQQRGSSYAANLQLDNFVPQSRDYYLRYYMKNDDTSSAGDHIVTVDTYQYPNLTFMRKIGNGTGFNFVTSFYGCGYTYPIGHWGPALTLANGAWYRFEYYVDFIDATHVQVHPRVYDAAGTLILSAADFRQSDFGGASWNGRSDWTLASYYAAGNSFCVDPAWVNDLGLGNNGQYGAADTGRYWYFSGVQIRTDTWPGAIPPR